MPAAPAVCGVLQSVVPIVVAIAGALIFHEVFARLLAVFLVELVLLLVVFVRRLVVAAIVAVVARTFIAAAEVTGPIVVVMMVTGHRRRGICADSHRDAAVADRKPESLSHYREAGNPEHECQTDCN